MLNCSNLSSTAVVPSFSTGMARVFVGKVGAAHVVRTVDRARRAAEQRLKLLRHDRRHQRKLRELFEPLG